MGDSLGLLPLTLIYMSHLLITLTRIMDLGSPVSSPEPISVHSCQDSGVSDEPGNWFQIIVVEKKLWEKITRTNLLNSDLELLCKCSDTWTGFHILAIPVGDALWDCSSTFFFPLFFLFSFFFFFFFFFFPTTILSGPYLWNRHS